MKRRAWHWVSCVVFGTFAACGGNSVDYPWVSQDDGARPFGRTIAEGGVIGDGGIVSDAGDGGVANVGDGGTFKLTVKILPQEGDAGASGIVKAAAYSPNVLVTEQFTNPADRDPVKTVIVNVASQDMPMMVVASAMLASDTTMDVPETSSTNYVYKTSPVDLGKLTSGTYIMTVTATTAGGLQAQDMVTITIDAGPIIQFITPNEGQSVRASVAIQVKIDDPVRNMVQNVSIALGKNQLTLAPPSGAAMDVYTANVDFNAFDPPLDGTQLITVRATDGNGIMATGTRMFTIDNDGPTITNTLPANGALIGQVIQISAQVTDPSGVVDSSVVAVIAHGGTEFVVQLDPPAAGAMPPLYHARFDTRVLSIHALFPTISFRAQDTLGNQSSIGYGLDLDNMPPLADLDPPGDFRGFFKVSGVLQCSWPFDPVGPDATDEGDYVNQLFDLRARIEDQGNDPLAGSVDYTPIATVDPAQANLLVLDDTSQPLVVDTDGDGLCDALNPLLTPTTMPMSSRDALLVNLVPITPGTNADRTPEPNAPCPTGVATALPDPLCDTVSNPSKAIYDSFGVAHSWYASMFMPYLISSEPAIWTIPPVVSNALQCGGTQFDGLGNHINDGWVCAVVSATDKLGNSQVSRVLHVCLDKDGVGNECPHVEVASASNTSPIVITTKTAHGYQSGSTAIVSGVWVQTSANGNWVINVTGPKTFELVGSTGVQALGAGDHGRVVLSTQLPDCTGTQTAKGPPPTVTSTPCKPWRLFPGTDARVFQ